MYDGNELTFQERLAIAERDLRNEREAHEATKRLLENERVERLSPIDKPATEAAQPDLVEDIEQEGSKRKK